MLLHPDESSGYLAWYNDNPDIRYWEVVVLEKQLLPDSSVIDVRVWRHEEWRQNYVRIPEDYQSVDLRNKYAVMLYGRNANHEILHEEAVIPFLADAPGLVPHYPGCFRICNGPDYAWKVQQWVPAGGGNVHYQLERASYFDPEEEEFFSYYEFMTLSDFNTWLMDYTNQFYYDIPVGVWNGAYTPDGFWMDKDNNPFITYRDKNGNIINDATFKAVRKAAGNWNDAISDVYGSSTPALHDMVSSNGLCMNNTVQHAVNLMNTHAYSLTPQLSCIEVSYPEGSGSTWAGDLSQCAGLLLEDSEDITSNIQAYLDCIAGLSGDNDGSSQSWDGVVGLHLVKYGSNGFPELCLTKSYSDLFDSDGVFIPFSVNLDPGLYKLMIDHADFGMFSPEAVFEIKTPQQFGVTLSQLFGHTIFPVPHVDDQYHITMQASSILNVGYTVYDFGGNVVHRSQYRLEQGHNENHFVDPDLPLPEGLILHRFDFEDGSFVTTTTLKSH